MNHTFTVNIKSILLKRYGDISNEIFVNSPLVQYLNRKTRSASSGSKSRGSFANIYAIYILVEDYLKNKFHTEGDYSRYQGAIYKNLFKRQRELPFGANLQNHALNNRLNAEFSATFPALDILPIIRLAESERYWINQNLLKITINNVEYNLAECVIEIIDEYINAKMESFDRFILACQELQSLQSDKSEEVKQFIIEQLAPNVDARLFEIVSYAILKYYYYEQKIYWSFELTIETMKEENLILYKTGRTNANDGGIDFVMKPLGRFFQVTETLDFKKYFLDINKLQKYPITFVIKSSEKAEAILKKIKDDALRTYTVQAIVQKYMDCIEEVINIPNLTDIFEGLVAEGKLNDILDEIIVQSKVEFNYNDDVDDIANIIESEDE